MMNWLCTVSPQYRCGLTNNLYNSNPKQGNHSEPDCEITQKH